MELGTIEREIYIDATPEVVFEVVSSPEHVKGWWPDDADYQASPGSSGTITFGGEHVEQFTVVDAIPPKMFAFRWTHAPGEVADEGNSLLVTFELTPSGGGTLVRMTETGFRERGWSQAVLEQCYREHVSGWDHFLPRILPYVATLRVRP
ncbi:activator of HSP90 ATPase [Actinoplanes ianthinogenes]|uniref:Activator of HSP90 ATPase n=1 Tax=Actinoplanes ianthinogenes TaxID=122358 RepID=A0ABN6CNU7_9ACTN|nr:SRPBCC family protein [Actinoplanes ianthinogenes]BCJ46911.1 activator of HSP90 ATPase [Actinoplanes ianthinogenes]GGR14695.1 activator of HSP90 ATPase [Actinoplanes ianthinogenes]